MTPSPASSPWPVGGGLSGQSIRALDWSATQLGPIADWPLHLRSQLDTVVSSGVPQALLWCDQQVVFANDAFWKLAGHDDAPLQGCPMQKLWPALAEWIAPAVMAGLRGEPQALRGQLSTVTGTMGPAMDLFLTPVSAPDGATVDGLLCTAVVMADAVNAGTKTHGLGDSRSAQFRLIDALPILVGFLDTSLTFRFANECYLQVFGLTADQVIGHSVDEVFGAAKAAAPLVALQAALQGETTNIDAALTLHGGGERRLFELRYLPRHAENDVIDGVYMILIDIEDRKRNEIELRHSSQRFRAAVDASHGVIWTNSPDGRMLGDQPAWGALTGQTTEAYAGYGWSEAVHPDDRAGTIAGWQKAVDGGTIFEWEHRLRRADGEYRLFQVRAVPVFDSRGVLKEWVGVHTDIGDQRIAEAQILAYAEDLERQIHHRKRAEEQLRQLNDTLEARVSAEIAERQRTEQALQQAQKMRTLGELTGGVAHDYNNLFQVIAGNLHLLAKDVAQDDRALARVNNALAGVERGAKLASQLLSFGRRQPLAPRVVDPGQLATRMSDLLRQSLGEGIVLDISVVPGLWNVCVDPDQLENALRNMAINARDAMDGNGRLTLSLTNIAPGSTASGTEEPQSRIEQAEQVRLTITDSGCGMTPDIVERMFEPFFTTKTEGSATGLGMSMVYGFVKQSSGDIWVDSLPGHGTTVTICLPRAMSDAVDVPHGSVGPATGGTETVLVVEDDDAVRATAVDLLESLGYRVLTARDAQAGLSVVESGVPLDVLFTDVVMPGPLSSRDMARQAKQLHPALAVLFTSGYARDVIVHDGRLDAGIELLSKPYTQEALSRKLRQVISLARPEPAPAEVTVSQEAAMDASAAPVAQAASDARPLSILLVEDNALIRADTAAMLAEMGHVVVQKGRAGPALQAVQSDDAIDLLLTDLGLPDMRGEELSRLAVAQRPALAVVYATGDASIPDGSPPQTVLLSKPYGEPDLRRAIASAIARV